MEVENVERLNKLLNLIQFFSYHSALYNRAMNYDAKYHSSAVEHMCQHISEYLSNESI